VTKVIPFCCTTSLLTFSIIKEGYRERNKERGRGEGRYMDGG
jgi:hypothetical protein